MESSDEQWQWDESVQSDDAIESARSTFESMEEKQRESSYLREELFAYLDQVKNKKGSDGKALIRIPSNFDTIVESMSREDLAVNKNTEEKPWSQYLLLDGLNSESDGEYQGRYTNAFNDTPDVKIQRGLAQIQLLDRQLQDATRRNLRIAELAGGESKSGRIATDSRGGGGGSTGGSLTPLGTGRSSYGDDGGSEDGFAGENTFVTAAAAAAGRKGKIGGRETGGASQKKGQRGSSGDGGGSGGSSTASKGTARTLDDDDDLMGKVGPSNIKRSVVEDQRRLQLLLSGLLGDDALDAAVEQGGEGGGGDGDALERLLGPYVDEELRQEERALDAQLAAFGRLDRIAAGSPAEEEDDDGRSAKQQKKQQQPRQGTGKHPPRHPQQSAQTAPAPVDYLQEQRLQRERNLQAQRIDHLLDRCTKQVRRFVTQCAALVL